MAEAGVRPLSDSLGLPDVFPHDAVRRLLLLPLRVLGRCLVCTAVLGSCALLWSKISHDCQLQTA